MRAKISECETCHGTGEVMVPQQCFDCYGTGEGPEPDLLGDDDE